MKNLISYFFAISILIPGCATRAQINSKILNVMKTDFDRISFHKLIFSELELIEFCKDSAGQELFNKSFNKFIKGIPQMKEDDIKESKITLTILFNRISQIERISQEQKDGKSFLLETLKNYKVNFTVTENFLINRFDSSKRGIIHGDDECSVSYSKYIFLVYDPLLYKKVFQRNKSISKDGVVYLPLKCTIKEDDGLLPIREVMKENLITLLSEYQDTAFYELIRRLKESDLEEEEHD
jgi:hypothetical protein